MEAARDFLQSGAFILHLDLLTVSVTKILKWYAMKQVFIILVLMHVWMGRFPPKFKLVIRNHYKMHGNIILQSYRPLCYNYKPHHMFFFIQRIFWVTFRYSVDFGRNEVEVLKHAANYLEVEKTQTLLELLDSTQLKVVYQPYDWRLNN